MIKVAIRTAGNNGKGVLKLLKENECYNNVLVNGFIDNDINKISTKIDDIPVYSIFKIKEKYDKGEIEKVIIPCEFHSIEFNDRHMIEGFCKELKEVGIKDEDILVSNLLFTQTKTEACTSFDKDFVKYKEFYHIRYMEFSAAFHCNLNCKGCSHFSPLVEEEFPNYENVKKDFYRLKQLVPLIHRIRILGGEPLLNPELTKYIKLIKEVYPYTDLRVVTNGILLKNLKDDVFKCFKENNVTVDISVYRPLRDNYDSVLMLLKEKGIKSTMYNCFEFVPTLKRQKESYPFSTTEKTCVYRNLADGYLSSCMLIHDIKYYNEYFKENIPHEDGLIDIHDPKLTSKELIRRLKMKHELCDYCESYKHMSLGLGEVYHDEIQISWGNYNKEDKPCKEDWLKK